MDEKISNNFSSMLKNFFLNYILKLIGEEEIAFDKIFQYKQKINMESLNYASYDNNKNELIIGMKNVPILNITLNNKIDDDDIKLIRCIIPQYFEVSMYSLQGKKINRYISKTHEKSNYEYAVQAGICNWIVGDNNKYEKMEALLNILEKWSMKTYEGKKVTYGIVINLNEDSQISESSKYGSFLDFLNDEFSAVLTDSITSVFEIDINCNLISYRTILDENCTNKVEGYDLINNIPYRFANVITNIVDNKKVGIFLLNNGDIILSKNTQIKFVKRNMHWLNFNIKSFKNSIRSFVQKYNIESKIIDEIYSTALDVSFAHTGGIIALVTKDDIIDSLDKASIVNRCDYISSMDTDEKIEEYLIKKNDLLNDKGLDVNELKKDINKKMLKRAMIRKMLKDKFQFTEISRKLRSELVSLDGACIINCKGLVYSFGAIIQNDSGSTGGGRGAAAKKLSSSGMAIKISTDGYIEVYLEQRKIYVIK